MISLRNKTGKATSFPAGMTIGASVSMLITLVISAGISYMLNKEIITWQQTGYVIMILLFVASFMGALTADAMIKRQRLSVSILSGLLYWGILLCITVLFFGSQFEAVGETALIIAAGSGVSCFITIPRSKRTHKTSTRAYR